MDFWKRVNGFRKNKRKKAILGSEKPSADDFVTFYSTLFSHVDRPSNDLHRSISSSVETYAHSLIDIELGNAFTYESVDSAIDNLKIGKASGYDGICNEFIKYGKCFNLISVLCFFFNAAYKTGILPDSFNTSVLIPIPKSDKISAPGDYRPISLSTSFSTMFETLCLSKLPCLFDLSCNQFGYTKRTSCKNAVFVANEIMNFYDKAQSNLQLL